MLRWSGVVRMLTLKTKLNLHSAGRPKGQKYKTLVWYHKDILPCSVWSTVKLFSKASNCQLVSDTTWGVCEMKPGTSENRLNDWEKEWAYFINYFPCSASSSNVAAVGRWVRSSNFSPSTAAASASNTRTKRVEGRTEGWWGLSSLVTQ